MSKVTQSSRRSLIREFMTTQSRVYEQICVFCGKTKYLKGAKTREALVQYVDLRADSTIRRAAVGKNDPRILAIVSPGNLLRQKRATISLVIVITLETFKELLAVVIGKRKMSVLNIPMQNHKPMKVCLPISKQVCCKTRGLLELLSCTPHLHLS